MYPLKWNTLADWRQDVRTKRMVGALLMKSRLPSPFGYLQIIPLLEKVSMNKHLIVLSSICTTLILGGCYQATEHRTLFVSDLATDSISTELFLPESNGLNVFQSICTDDSFLYCLDYYNNDSILKIYPLTPYPTLSRFAAKGQGPNDLIFPAFSREVAQYGNPIKILDISAWCINEIQYTPTAPEKMQFNKTPLPIVPTMEDFAETDSCIYGTDIDSQESLFFIYNKKNRKITHIGFWQDTEHLTQKYPKEAMPFLLSGPIMLHPTIGICKGMTNMNSIFFYNLQGQLLKEVVIGTKRMWPQDGRQEFLDFPEDNKYTFCLTGTKQHLYVLYHAHPISAHKQHSKILQFDWNGNLLRNIQTDKNLSRIAITPDGTYIYAIADTEEGGTDVVRLQL